MTDERRRLVLHVGLSKTGTTTIQTFCRKNESRLAREGVLYPRVGAAFPEHPAFRATVMKANAAREVNHSALAAEIRLNRGEDALKGGGLADGVPLWEAARREADRSNCHTTIVSYENFYHHIDRYDFSPVRRLFADFEVTAIIYLRRPEDWGPSLYGQQIRGQGRRAWPFDRFARSMKAEFVFSRLLDTVEARIGPGRLVVRDFDEARRVGLLGDFFDLSGLPTVLSADDAAPQRNTSPPWWAVLFLRECNRAGLSDEVFVEVRKGLLRVAAAGEIAIRPGLHVATPDDLAELRTLTAQDADRLAARHGVRLNGEARPGPAYRPFDADDMRVIGDALVRRLPAAARTALDEMTAAPARTPAAAGSLREARRNARRAARENARGKTREDTRDEAREEWGGPRAGR